jgi:hypothetical protein
METIQFIQYTAEQLQVEINKGIQTQLDEFLKHFKPVNQNEYISRNQVSKLYGISLKTVDNYSKSKILNPLGMEGSNRVFFLRSEIEASLKPLNV